MECCVDSICDRLRLSEPLQRHERELKLTSQIGFPRIPYSLQRVAQNGIQKFSWVYIFNLNLYSFRFLAHSYPETTKRVIAMQRRSRLDTT